MFYDVRCSGDSFLLNHRGGADGLERPSGAEAVSTVCASSDQGSMINSEKGVENCVQPFSQNAPIVSRSCDDATHLLLDTANLHNNCRSPAGTTSCTRLEASILNKSDFSGEYPQNFDTPTCAANDHDQQLQTAADQNDRFHPKVEAAALEVGIERYLGMADAIPGSDNCQMQLRHALKLAVEDRIRCRM